MAWRRRRLRGSQPGPEKPAPPWKPFERCGNTIHSEHVSDHRCRRERGHSGDCVFGDARL